MSMKRIISYLSIPVLALAASCVPKEEIVFNHEERAFDTRSNMILVEGIMPQASVASEEIYIIGDFNGGEAAIGNPDYLMTHSDVITSKWGIYLDPTRFQGGKTLADGFTFYSVQQGLERSPKNEDVSHKLTIGTGEWANVYVDKWAKYFAPPETPEEIVLPELDGYGFFVDATDAPTYAEMALYAWGSGLSDANDLFGGWPGMQPTGTWTCKGVTYTYFDLGSRTNGLTVNFIINNNGAGSQLEQFDAFKNQVIDHNFFFKITDEDVTVVDDPSGGGGIVIPAHDGVRVWVDDQSGWDAIALYMWGDINNFGGDWPGMQVGGSETIGGVVYKYFEYGDDIYGLSENLIFNNNGNGTQHPDVNVTFEDGVQDYFFQVTADGAAQIDGPGGGGGVTPPPTPPEPTYGPKVYVQDLTTWGGDLYAHYWGDAGNTEWPGVKFEETETVDGIDFRVFTTDGNFKGQTVGIIFHSDVDDATNRVQTEMTFDMDRYYVLTNDGIVEADMGVRIIVKDKSGWPGSIYAHMWTDEFGTDWPGVKASDGLVNGEQYIVFLTPKALKGQTVNVIFHSDENDAENRYQTVVTLDKDRFYVLGKEFTFQEEEKKPVNIYVDDKTGWDAIALYLWGDVNNLGGDWPGIQVTRTEDIMGTTYKVFTVPNALGLTENLIFNNNNNGTQLDNYEMTFTAEEYFLIVTAEGVTPSERPTIDPAKRVTVYVDDQTGWEGIALYMWGDVNNLGGGWPGIAVSGTVDKGGKSWKTFVIENAIGLSENLIFNNNGNGVQHPDYALAFEQNEYFFQVTADGVALVDDPTQVTVYVDDQTGWEGIALYMWGDVNNLGGGWPGVAVSRTETIAGTDWKVFVIKDAMGLSENLIFNNNGNGVQHPDYALKYEKSAYFFRVTADGVTAVDDPR